MLILSLVNDHQSSMIFNFCKCKHYIAGYYSSVLLNYKTTIYIQIYLWNKTGKNGNLSDIKIYLVTVWNFQQFLKKQKRQTKKQKAKKCLSFPRCSQVLIVFGIYRQWSHLLLSLSWWEKYFINRETKYQHLLLSKWIPVL